MKPSHTLIIAAKKKKKHFLSCAKDAKQLKRKINNKDTRAASVEVFSSFSGFISDINTFFFI